MQIRRHTDLRVGHAGTLDPFAEGLLLVLVGRATKLSEKLTQSDKTYLANIELGTKTDSGDCTGKVVEQKEIPLLTAEKVQSVLDSFLGEWEQMPPMFSAKKINGVRLYELARKNQVVERKKVKVNIFEAKLMEFNPTSFKVQLKCSKGTYVRSFAEEVGERLGTTAYLKELARLQCGNFKLEEGIGLADFLKSPSTCFESGSRRLSLV
jgi:tRNA pseudouridine55 synthase